MRQLMILFPILILHGWLPDLASAQQQTRRPPIIDVHLHAMSEPALRTLGQLIHPVTRAAPPVSAEEHVQRTLAEMHRRNVVLGIVPRAS